MLTRLALLSLAVSTSLAAQDCLDNEFPITFVDANGEPARSTRIDPYSSSVVSLFDGKDVFLALPPDFPPGRYFVQVSDSENQEVLSETVLLDRVFIVGVDPGTGEQTITPESPDSPPLGVGLGGFGQSIPLFPARAPDTGIVNPKTGRNPVECEFKVTIGNCYDRSALANLDVEPYGIRTGLQNPDEDGNCCVRSFSRFQVGNQSGSVLSGHVFLDTDEDGVRDDGEPGIADCPVTVDDGTTVIETLTDANGDYSFSGLPGGSYSVSISIDPNGEFLATTPTEYASLGVCGCAPETVPDFGKARRTMKCAGRRPVFWASWRGLKIIKHRELLGCIRALPLVDTWGRAADPCTVWGFRRWLRWRNSWNMAYSLSAQVAAMYLNIETGFVDPDCRLTDPCLGTMTAGELVRKGIEALLLDNCTTRGNPNRELQRKLRNALWRANANRIWN